MGSYYNDTKKIYRKIKEYLIKHNDGSERNDETFIKDLFEETGRQINGLNKIMKYYGVYYDEEYKEIRPLKK